MLRQKSLASINDDWILRKIRQLIKDLESFGFIGRGGKGSHKNYLHAKCPYSIKKSLAGNGWHVLQFQRKCSVWNT